MKKEPAKAAESAVQIPRIMVIEDDPLQALLLDRILSGEGHQTCIYHDAATALENVVYDGPDLILTDLIMPEIDGFEVIRRLKADKATKHIPIILVTGATDKNAEIQGLQLGAVDYIVKPFAAEMVIARLQIHLELKHHRDALESLVREQTAALNRSQRQFQDLVEKSLVGIAIIMDGQLVYQNPELLRIVKHLDKKVVDQEFSFIHPDDWPKIQQAYKHLMRPESQHVEADFRVMSESGDASTLQTIWINCRAVKFQYKEREAILVNVTDISHTKELERLLLLRNKMASLGRIASGMAHEIRNPLTGITSYLYSLEQLCEQETLLPKDIALMGEIVGQLKLGSHKIDTVIKRVLDFARPTPPQMVQIDLNQRLNNVLQLTAVTMRKAGIKVTTDLAPSLPLCYGDVVLLEQVFLNLVQNAAHAVDKSSAEKQIDIHSYALDNLVCASIADSGPGVPEKMKEKVFDPFFTTSSDGSGIGLSIAQRIITDHNGSLSLDDGPLGGARFSVSIPIEKRKLKR